MSALTPLKAAERSRKGWITRRARGHVKPKKLAATELKQLHGHFGGEPVMRPLKDTPTVGPADPRDPSRTIINHKGHLFWRHHRHGPDTGPLGEQQLIPITRHSETQYPRNFTADTVKEQEASKKRGDFRILVDDEDLDLHYASMSPKEAEPELKDLVKRRFGQQALTGAAKLDLQATKHRHALQHFYYNGLKEGRKLQDIDDEVMFDDIYDNYPVVFERIHQHVKAPIHLKEIHVGSIPKYVKKHGASGYKDVDQKVKGQEEVLQLAGGLYHPKNQAVIMPRSGPELEQAAQMANKAGIPGTLGEHGALAHELGHAHDPYLHGQKVGKVKDYLDNKSHPRSFSHVANLHAGHHQYQHTNEAEDFAEQFRHHLGFFGEGGGDISKLSKKQGQDLLNSVESSKQMQLLGEEDEEYADTLEEFMDNNPPQIDPRHVFNMPATKHKQTLLGYKGHDRSFNTYVTRSEDRDRRMLEEVFHIPQ